MDNKASINVQHVQASQCAVTGQRIDTLILEYPRCIHAQLLTHRVFSKNSSSSRAVPIKKAIEQIKDNPAEFVWTLNQAGMQGNVASHDEAENFENIFKLARADAIHYTEALAEQGAHKQNVGRLLEPFQNIKIVLTSTEWENWDWLRIDGAAQGEIKQLAEEIKKARDEAEVMVLKEGEWHVPFVTRGRLDTSGEIYYTVVDGAEITTLTPEEALAVSTSACAQTSYRNLDLSLEKAQDLLPKLFDGAKVHASPSEHQAKPVGDANEIEGHKPARWPKGITHKDREGNYWSGNFKGFIQHRQLLDNHDKAKF